MALKFDLDVMKNAEASYQDYATRMAAVKTNLRQAIDAVRSDWDTDAGAAFFAKFDDDWERNVEDYIAVIQHMSDNMRIANSNYSSVWEEAKALNL